MSDFHRRLEEQIPRLRRYARALTRDASRADDLVQDTLLRALAKQHLWQEGTNLRAWLFTLMHNQHVNDVRRSNRDGGNVDVTEMASVLVANTDPTASRQLRELERGLACCRWNSARRSCSSASKGCATTRPPRRGRPDRHDPLAPVARPRGAAEHSGHRGGRGGAGAGGTARQSFVSGFGAGPDNAGRSKRDAGRSGARGGLKSRIFPPDTDARVPAVGRPNSRPIAGRGCRKQAVRLHRARQPDGRGPWTPARTRQPRFRAANSAAASTTASPRPWAPRRWSVSTACPSASGVTGEVLAKLEFFNPMSSVKDRIGVSMIDAAEGPGKIKPGVSMLIEPTSGNTGIALAFVGRRARLQADLTMPEIDVDRAAQDAALAGRRARADAAREGHDAARSPGAEELVEEMPDTFMPQQFQNPANPADPSPHHGRGDLERHRRRASISSSPASAPAAPSPASARC